VTGPQEQWQVEASVPELYERHLVSAVTAMWAHDLIERVGVAAGDRVLDVACGTGVVARQAAERVGAAGSVDAVDLNPAMLAHARTLAGTGAPIEFHEASALDLPFDDGCFDVVFCQLGLQFFPDRAVALREMHRVLVPGGRLALNVFAPIERNPATHALADALDRHIGPLTSVAKRTEHALADPGGVHRLVAGAGFRDVRLETTTKTARFRSPEHYVLIQLSATPLAAVAGAIDPAKQAAVVDDVTRALARFVDADGLAFPQELHVVLARR
jgi:ubiquinone/menaquinone biosynthesis C-methylase UbiE